LSYSSTQAKRRFQRQKRSFSVQEGERSPSKGLPKTDRGVFRSGVKKGGFGLVKGGEGNGKEIYRPIIRKGGSNSSSMLRPAPHPL